MTDNLREVAQACLNACNNARLDDVDEAAAIEIVLRSHFGPSPCGRDGHLMCHWREGRAPSFGSPLPEIQPHCTLCEAERQVRSEAVRECAKVGHKVAFEYLDMQRNQREYSWHDVEDALTKGSQAILALDKGGQS